ncbi:MAG: peptidoglycan editing factor PgeF [Bacteroides sp.]
MIPLTVDNRMLGYESLGSCSNISHFVTTRYGGCGDEAYSSFNCSPFCGDKEETVCRNQQWLLEALPQRPRELLIPFQVHGTNIRVIDDSFLAASAETRKEELNGIDALMTREPGCCICISTADCVPVLLYDPKQRVVAAVHAGWRGTLESVVSRVLAQMFSTFGTDGADVLACIGPSISLESFEVGEEVYHLFHEKGFDLPRLSIWNEKTKKHHLDLWEANRLQLLVAGVPAGQIETAGICTYIHHDDFFSARRLGVKSGRILSGIVLNKE